MVARMDSDAELVRDFMGDEGSVSCAIAAEHTVTAGEVNNISLIAPIVALILEHIQFSRDEWTVSEVKTVEA
ncbi:hypothetical protein F441_22458 [Phytophthora nicotianae CJ01A1]|nr:hypothetical protein L915_04377 [Phytophthora nicotianae]ETL24246.1 hypothetical protein L916_21741 [Phytophthora nicotianae]ETP00120.1 hypothetical protein F441_22458 [Phytophthora nicotianae CJ01A1]